MAEETNGNVTVYLYDDSGSPIGMQYHAATSGEYEWEVYWYEKNLQGDIVAIYTDTDVKLASYNYDAWGNTFATYYYGAENSKVADNPFTYRGYYFDKDLNLYYLGARYYDSNTCRFINVDESLYHSMLGYNMYAYCNNNPVNYYDPSGRSAIGILIGIGSGIAVIDGPLPFGDIAAIGVIIVGGIIVAKKTVDVAEAVNDSPKSIDDKTDSENETGEGETVDENSNSPSNPGKLEIEIKRGQAPKDVKTAHPRHSNGKPHIHFKDGTAMNNDGTIHDAHKGIPRLSNAVKKWLRKHNWPTEIKVYRR